MKAYNLVEYRDADCPFLLANQYIFIALHREVKGKVCDTGCASFDDGGKCPAYKKLISEVKVRGNRKPEETVRQMASRLGVSISEVRRRRQKSL